MHVGRQARLKDELLSLSDELHSAQRELEAASGALRRKQELTAAIADTEQQAAGGFGVGGGGAEGRCG